MRELLYDFGGGSRSGRPIKAVQVGGPLGTYLPESQWDLPLDYEAYAAAGAVVGHGGIVVHDDTADMSKLARYAMEFCAIESCGKCTPCRIGSTRGMEVIDRISSNQNRAQQVILLRDLCDTMVNGSLCAMGSMTPLPVLSALNHYPEDFGITRPDQAGGLSRRQHVHGTKARGRLRHTSQQVSRTHHARDRRRIRHRAEGHVADARGRRGRHQVPKLCATDSLNAFGSCRLCLVEIEGRKGYPASCTTPAEAGMKVRTQTPKLQELRQGVMELYISDHPADCLTCSRANGDCELQDMAVAVGPSDVRYGVGNQYGGAHHLNDTKDESNPYFAYDPAKCIVCNRCVRACEETQGTFALTVSGRGFASRIAAGQDQAFMDSECVSCGACVQACPTGTLQEKIGDLARPARAQRHHHLRVLRRGLRFKAEMKGNEVVRMVPWKDGKANEGHSCVKGRFAWGYATHQDRITKPMIRKKITDPWQEVSWEDAINYAATRVQAPAGQVRHGFDRRHHLVALHQRRNLPGAEAGARGLRQQQRRHLRARVPLAHRLRPRSRRSANRPARRPSSRSRRPT